MTQPAEKRAEPTPEPQTYPLILSRWEGGRCVYLNDYRIAGGKPWGGGRTEKNWNVTLKDLLSAIPGLDTAAERDRLKAANAELAGTVRAMLPYMDGAAREAQNRGLGETSGDIEKTAEQARATLAKAKEPTP